MPESKNFPLVLLGGETPYTTSEIVSEFAGIKRKAVQNLIKRHEGDLSEFGKVVFKIRPLPGSKTGQKTTVYRLNEQQATLLMTYLKNTEQVRAFKKELVRQFYAMRDFIAERQSPIWQDTRTLTKEVRRMETDAIKAFVLYAQAQGSQNAARYYSNISRLANRTAGIIDRNTARTEQLTVLMLVERIILREIDAGIQAGEDYRAIYQKVRDRLVELDVLVAMPETSQRKTGVKGGGKDALSD